jgi:hypothetical protein
MSEGWISPAWSAVAGIRRIAYSLQDDTGEFEKYWKRLSHLGCSYEGGQVGAGTLYSVDVPDTTDVYEVYKILEQGQNDGVWMFDEGRVGHPIKSES